MSDSLDKLISSFTEFFSECRRLGINLKGIEASASVESNFLFHLAFKQTFHGHGCPCPGRFLLLGVPFKVKDEPTPLPAPASPIHDALWHGVTQ